MARAWVTVAVHVSGQPFDALFAGDLDVLHTGQLIQVCLAPCAQCEMPLLFAKHEPVNAHGLWQLLKTTPAFFGSSTLPAEVVDGGPNIGNIHHGDHGAERIARCAIHMWLMLGPPSTAMATAKAHPPEPRMAHHGQGKEKHCRKQSGQLLNAAWAASRLQSLQNAFPGTDDAAKQKGLTL